MTMKKTVSLILALVMVFSCVAMLSSCKRSGGEAKLSKREHVYAEKKLEVDSDINIGYVNNLFTDGENLIMTYNAQYTIVRDENGEEVERFDGFYSDYSGGVYEEDDDIILYGAEELLSSSVPAIDFVPEDEGELDEFDEAVPTDEMPVSNDVIDIMPVPVPGDDEEFEIEGEPDEFGVITDENFNIKVPEGWYVDYAGEDVFARVPLEGGEVKNTSVNIDKFFELEEGEYGYSSGVFMGSDGNIRALYNTDKYDEATFVSTNKYYILNIDIETGDLIEKKLLNDCFKAAGVPDQNTYISTIFFDKDDNVYFAFDGGDIYVADKDMNFVKKIHAGDGYISSMSGFGDKIFIGMYDANYTKQMYATLENGEITPVENSEALNDYIYDFLGGYGSRIYFRRDSGIFYYDFETEEVGEECNFLNSDIDYMNIGRVILLDDGKMLLTKTDWKLGSEKTTLYLITRVPEEEIKEELIITVGTIWSDYNLIESIMKYNKQNNGTRISLRTYEQYNNEENDYNGASTQLNKEIIDGTLPDIVCIYDTLPVQSYFRKGVFVDLNKYIDDEENGIDRAMLLDNVLRASETNGKLYSLITSFSINTLAAKTKFVGEKEGWTFADMMNAIKNMPEGMEAFCGIGRNDILSAVLNYSMNSLVDWSNGTNKFDSPEFIEFIKYLATCPEKGLWEEYYGSMPEGEYVFDEEKEREIQEKMQLRFWKDTGLFDTVYVGAFDSLQNTYREFATRDITFIGFPTDDENSTGAVITPSTEFAVSSKSKVKDQAWDFLKFLLTDYDDEDYMWQFSINRDRIEMMKKNTLERNGESYLGFYNDDYDYLKEMGYSDDYIEFMKNSNVLLDEDMVNAAEKILMNANTVSRTDAELLDIINEELSAFFAGTKSAEETAKIIAGRAKTFIGERS